jgi:ABC-2 type transport system permease protein
VSDVAQAALVARREVLERWRSRAFRASLVLMVLIVVGVIVVPSVLGRTDTEAEVGLAGTVPVALADAIVASGAGVDLEVTVRSFDRLSDGEAAVRDGEVDVLVVDGDRLEWQRTVDERLRSVVVGAVQQVAFEARAVDAGVRLEDRGVLLDPVPVTNVELGQVEGRSPDDETAAFVMTVVLFMAISSYGAMVMTGVVEEKSNRVVEVLLARVPARTLLTGKITGIGLLGLGQIAVTAVAALVALALTEPLRLPAVRGAVLAWMVVWFVLGYALYATVFGALGALASRSEDAQAAVGPVTAVLVAAYFVSFAAIGSPDAAWARFVSYFPPTAPLAMPNRLAMGDAAWWEPVLAAGLTAAAIAGLVVVGGRVYAGGVLHNGPRLGLGAALRGATPPHRPQAG